MAGHLTPEGYLLTISDHGMGIPTERLAELNDTSRWQFKGQGDILTELQANTAITSDIKDLMEAARGTKKFAGWAKQGLVYVAAVLGAVVGIYGALYALTHGGKLP